MSYAIIRNANYKKENLAGLCKHINFPTKLFKSIVEDFITHIEK